jgi:hypothetical protein
LTCRKCHAPFHLNRDRVGVIGEPPDVVEELEETAQKVSQKLEKHPWGRTFARLTGLVAVCALAYAFFGRTERVEQVADVAAEALAGDNPDYLATIAANGTAEDLDRWFARAYSRLVQTRKGWNSLDEVSEVHILSRDDSNGKAVVGMSIHPAAGPSRVMPLTDPSQANAGPPAAFDVTTDWTLTRWGRWKLDGRATLAREQPGAPATVSPGGASVSARDTRPGRSGPRR